MKPIAAFLFIALIACSETYLLAQSPLKTYGVQLNVTDMGKALRFYSDVLGFETVRNDSSNGTILLKPKTGNDKIVLNKVFYLLPVADKEARASLTLQVNDLDSAIASLKSKGLHFGTYQKRKEGVGYAVYFDDPFGTRLSMMHETVVSNPHFEEPKVYNYGFYLPDMDSAIAFYSTRLGFPLRSKKYLPLDAPLNNPDGSFGFMLHTREGVQAVHYNAAANEHVVLLFRTANIGQAIEALKAKGVKVASQKIAQTTLGKTVSFYDPFGYLSLLIETNE